MRKLLKKRVYVSLIVIILVLYYVLVVRGSYVCHYFNQVSQQELQQLPELEPIKPSDRVLVFAPHPDDETLSCAGLIQRALRSGAHVHVVFMTNGDAFMRAIKLAFNTNDVSPLDAVNFGKLRQKEVGLADGRLGLKASDTTFLGYPDKGLTLMWYYHWLPAHSYRSLITRTNFNPYSNAPKYDEAYCGANVMDDVEEVVQTYKPTKIFTVMSGDQHIDHDGTALYVNTVLARLVERDPSYERKCQLYGYIIHYNDWPYPRGRVANGYMAPPREMMNNGMKWFRMPLDSHDEKTKSAALNEYKSQMRDDALLLTSFVRRNEVFTKLPIGIDASHEVSIPQPSDRCLVPRFEKGVDIESVKLHRYGSNLDVTIQLKGTLNPRCEYRCAVRSIDKSYSQLSSMQMKIVHGYKTHLRQVKFYYNHIADNTVIVVTASSYLDKKLQDRMLDQFVR